MSRCPCMHGGSILSIILRFSHRVSRLAPGYLTFLNLSFLFFFFFRKDLLSLSPFFPPCSLLPPVFLLSTLKQERVTTLQSVIRFLSLFFFRGESMLQTSSRLERERERESSPSERTLSLSGFFIFSSWSLIEETVDITHYCLLDSSLLCLQLANLSIHL